MIEVQASISINRDGNIFLNPLKTELLQEIRDCQSIKAAAKKLGLSYQHVWNMINEMNNSAPFPLIIKQRGGSNGGGAEISAYGRKMLKEYNEIGEVVQKTINQINVEINL